MRKFIVLVQPFTHGRTTVRPLGLGYLGSVLLKDGYVVKIIDNDLNKLKSEDLAKEIISISPDVVGITTNVLNKWNAIELGNALGNHIKYIVFGGPEATLFPDWFLKRKNFFVLSGESERSFLSFMKYVEGSIPRETVEGLSFLNENNEVINNSLPKLEENLDNLPFPNTDLFEMDRYRFKFEDYYCTHIISSRGCPFKCIFCYHRLSGKFRQRSPENVIDEIKMLKQKYGFRSFKFFDDNFTLRKTFVYDFCQELIKENIKIFWHCLSSSKNIDKDLVKIMYKSGCREIHFGMESGSPNSLKLMKKSCKVEDNTRAIELCRKVGIRSKAYITIGYPWETIDDIYMTANFLRKYPPDYIQVLIVFPFADTDLEKLIIDKGYMIDYDVIRGVRDLDVPSYETENFKKNDLIKWRELLISEHKRGLWLIKPLYMKIFENTKNVCKRLLLR